MKAHEIVSDKELTIYQFAVEVSNKISEYPENMVKYLLKKRLDIEALLMNPTRYLGLSLLKLGNLKITNMMYQKLKSMTY